MDTIKQRTMDSFKIDFKSFEVLNNRTARDVFESISEHGAMSLKELEDLAPDNPEGRELLTGQVEALRKVGLLEKVGLAGVPFLDEYFLTEKGLKISDSL